VSNLKPSSVSGEVTITGVTNQGVVIELPPMAFSDLAEGDTISLNASWTANIIRTSAVSWTATVTAEGDLNSDNDTRTATTKIRR
jgi:hypothetical protein